MWGLKSGHCTDISRTYVEYVFPALHYEFDLTRILSPDLQTLDSGHSVRYSKRSKSQLLATMILGNPSNEDCGLRTLQLPAMVQMTRTLEIVVDPSNFWDWPLLLPKEKYYEDLQVSGREIRYTREEAYAMNEKHGTFGHWEELPESI